MKFIVYITVNKVNGKTYVGVHKTDSPYKFDGYIGNGIRIRKKIGATYPTNTVFHMAFRKYGQKAFIRHTLFIFDKEASAYEMEASIITIEWVKSDKNYNTALGGVSGAGLHTMKTVYQYTIDGIFIKKFDSIALAAEGLKVANPSNISRCANGITSTAYGFTWCFSKILNRDVRSTTRSIIKSTIDGTILQEFDSLKSAADSIGLSNTSSISNCARGYNSTAYGFNWRYSDDKNIRSTVSKSIVRINTVDQVADDFNSIRNAAKSTNIDRSIIVKALKSGKEVSGYIWKFL